MTDYNQCGYEVTASSEATGYHAHRLFDNLTTGSADFGAANQGFWLSGANTYYSSGGEYISAGTQLSASSSTVMIDVDEQKNEVAKAKVVSNKVTSLGFGDAIRKKVAQYADVRDDVRGSAVPKRKRRDAHDFRNDLVNSFVPDYGYNVGDGTAFGDGMTMIVIVLLSLELGPC